MTKAHPHRQVNVHLDTVDDADIIERIEEQPSFVGYIRRLVRRDIHDERLDYAALKISELGEELRTEREENRWAREFLNRIGPKCGTKDCPSLVAYVNRLESDNAKLRELCTALYRCRDKVNECATCEDVECPFISDCRLHDRMCELGVET